MICTAKASAVFYFVRHAVASCNWIKITTLVRQAREQIAGNNHGSTGMMLVKLRVLR